MNQAIKEAFDVRGTLAAMSGGASVMAGAAGLYMVFGGDRMLYAFVLCLATAGVQTLRSTPMAPGKVANVLTKVLITFLAAVSHLVVALGFNEALVRVAEPRDRQNDYAEAGGYTTIDQDGNVEWEGKDGEQIVFDMRPGPPVPFDEMTPDEFVEWEKELRAGQTAPPDAMEVYEEAQGGPAEERKQLTREPLKKAVLTRF